MLLLNHLTLNQICNDLVIIGEQNLVHFVHRDSLFHDYIFTLGYYLALQPDGDLTDVFPGFKPFALDDEGKSDSKIADAFKRKWKLLFDIIQKYLYTDPNEADTVNRNIDLFCLSGVAASLAAHGAKKLGIQTMGDIMSMTIQDISMRGGWALKSFNTFFDYWVGSYASSVRSGKALAGWINRAENGYHGGSPPSMDDIDTDKDKVERFVNEVLGHHKHVNVPMQRFLVANLLRHWDELIKALQQEPKGKWDGAKVNDHPFIHQVRSAIVFAGGSDATLKEWIKEVTQGYVQRNSLSLPVHMCSAQPDIVIDTRSFIEIVKGMSTQ